jgi:histone-lysine N-methyltransferase SETD3
MAPPRTFGGVDCAGAVDDAFWAWATAEGVEAVSCAPALFREGWRGVAATGDVAPGDVVLRVPGSLLMSARSAALDPDLAAALETHGGALTPAERLSCHLLHEASKGAHSRWRAYVRQLPRRYNLLASWTAGEIEALQAPDAIAVAERAKAEMRASHIKALTVLKHLGLPPPFQTANAWTWARCTVSSRTVFVPFDDAGALCPVGDLFNYAPPPASTSVNVLGTPLGTEELAALLGGRTRGAENFAAPSSKKNDENDAESVDFSAGDGSYDAALDAYVFYARRRYERGDQIMLCYGKHTNLSLLEHYGFLLPPGSTNANDAAPLAPVPGFGAGEFRKIHHRVSADARGRLTWTSLADLRADAADADADVRRLGLAKRARDVCRRGKAVSPAVERRVFEAVRDAAGRTLLSLATTAAQDEEAIAAARDEERKSAALALESTDGRLGGEARTERDAALDEHGAPREWTRGDGVEDEDDDDDDDDASDFRADESNAWLAARWRLAYKRAVQAAYRLAQARVDEAVQSMGAAGRGDAHASSSDARVAKPRLGAR